MIKSPKERLILHNIQTYTMKVQCKAELRQEIECLKVKIEQFQSTMEKLNDANMKQHKRSALRTAILEKELADEKRISRNFFDVAVQVSRNWAQDLRDKKGDDSDSDSDDSVMWPSDPESCGSDCSDDDSDSE